MAQLNLDIGGRSFSLSCQDGEEEHLKQLGLMLDMKAREAGDLAGLTESRMLLFTALLLADELYGFKTAAETAAEAQPVTLQIDEQAISALEKLANRAEALANSLE